MKLQFTAHVDLDTDSQFYKNCKRQRKNRSRCCDECPFKMAIEWAEDVEDEVLTERKRR